MTIARSKPGRRILVCDDESQIVRALEVVLRDAGFEVATAATGDEALDRAAVRPPDAAIIDLILPDGDGVEVTQGLREWSDMPILLLSAVTDEAEKVRALNAGADDYLTKPFGPDELVARLNAVLRRALGHQNEPSIVIDALELDLSGHTAAVSGEPVHLTRIELALLKTLVLKRGHRLARVGAAGLDRSDTQARLSLRVRVILRRSRLDCLLAAGADPSWDPELALRAAQIAAPRRRRALADSLQRAVWEAHQPPHWDCRAPLDRRAVRAATPELSALALDLTLEAAPAAQGIALATQLLRDPCSPLYAPGGEQALRAAAVIARRALVQSAVHD